MTRYRIIEQITNAGSKSYYIEERFWFSWINRCSYTPLNSKAEAKKKLKEIIGEEIKETRTIVQTKN